jgi:hypothetical protein
MKLLRCSATLILLLLAGEACAGAVYLSFTAQPQGVSVVIQWKTWMEFDNRGFNLYRSEKKDGDYAKINSAFIPTKSSGPSSGGSYALTDTAVVDRTKYYYRLEAVDAKGASQFIDTVPVLVENNSWVPEQTGTASVLYDIWGSAQHNIIAVGEGGTILRYDGSSWNTDASGTTIHLSGIWGSAMDDIYAVGDKATLLHYDGVRWSPVAHPLSGTDYPLYDVWGSSATDVFVAGFGAVIHYDGTVWSRMDLSAVVADWSSIVFNSVWGSSGADVYVSVDWGVIHYDGKRWSLIPDITIYGSISALWGSAADDIFVTGNGYDKGMSKSYGMIWRFDGTAWMGYFFEYNLSCVWGNTGADVYAAGPGGTLLHYDGSEWVCLDSGTASALHSLWGNPEAGVFVAGENGTILRCQGNATTTTTVPAGSCPAKTVLGDCGQDLNALRLLRNELFLKTPNGRQYAALYYKHAVELSVMFAHNAQLKEQARMLMQSILPAIESLLVKRKAAISDDVLQQADVLIDALTARAGPALRQDLTRLKKDIGNGITLKTFGVVVLKN